MATIFEMKKNALKALEECITLAANCKCADAAKRLEVLKQELKKRELMLIVVGEARRGKSSMLNAILEETEPLFPVDIHVCTNVVTTVRYGKTETVHVVYAAEEGKEPRIEKITRAQIRDYVCEQGNPDNYKNIVRLDIALPNKHLEKGLVFVDTPGVGSLNIRHAQTTYALLPSADLLLFVSDCTTSLTASELDFLKKGYSYCKNLLYPMTMKDSNQDYQLMVDDNRSKISAALQLPEEDIRIIPVSSTNKQAYLKTGEESLYKASNYEMLDDTLWATVTRTSTEKMILPYLYAARQELQQLLENAQIQAAALKDSTIVQDFVEKLNSLNQQLDALKKGNAAWRSNLSLFFNTLHTSITPKMQVISQLSTRELDTAAAKYENDICKPKNYQKVGENVCHLINNEVSRIYDELDASIAQQLQEMNDTLQIHLVEDKGNNALVPVSDIHIDLPKQGVADRMLTAGRNMNMQSMGSKSILGVIGGIAGGIFSGEFGMDPRAGFVVGYAVGSQVGQSLGMLRATIESLSSKYNQVDAAYVMKELRYLASIQISTSRANIDNYISASRAALTQSYDQQIVKKQQELKLLQQELQRNVTVQKSDRERKLAALEGQIGQFTAAIAMLNGSIEAVEKAAQTAVPTEAAKMTLDDYDFL